MSDLAYSARKFTYSVFEAVYKMSIIENTPCDDKYSVIDLAHWACEVAYSVFDVIYKMIVLKNTPCEV